MLIGTAIGAAFGFIGNCITNLIAGDNILDGWALATISGAASGLLAASGLGVVGQAIGNAIISAGTNIYQQSQSGGSFDWLGFGLETALGFASGLLGGAGVLSKVPGSEITNASFGSIIDKSFTPNSEKVLSRLCTSARISATVTVTKSGMSGIYKRAKKKAAISELYRANRDLGAKESSKFYKELNNGFITLKNIPNPNNMSEKDSDSLKQKAIRHYHAITAHKSQGGEFTNVFVDDSDIRRAAKNTDELSYKKLIYTAVSRAKEKAVIVTNGFRFDKAANKFVDQNEQNTIPVEFRNNSALNKESKTEDRPSDKC